jgi:hypothetical protein
MDGSFRDLKATELADGHILALPFERTALITSATVGRDYVSVTFSHDGQMGKTRMHKYDIIPVLNPECPGCGLRELRGPFPALPEWPYYECHACSRHVEVSELFSFATRP